MNVKSGRVRQALREFRERISHDDPLVQEVLDGVSQITGHLHERLDQDLPGALSQLIRQHAPAWLKARASMTVIQLMNPQAIAYTLPQGTCVEAKLAKPLSVPCTFQTTRSVNLYPLQISHCAIEERAGEGWVTRLDFSTIGDVAVKSIGFTQLVCYLQGDYEDVSLAYYAYLRHVEKVEVLFSCGRGARLGDQRSIVAFPSCDGAEALMNYIIDPEADFFLKLQGFDQVDWPASCAAFTLEIFTPNFSHSLWSASSLGFHLHCVPAVNHVSWESAPIAADRYHLDYSIEVDGGGDDLQIMAIESVIGIALSSGERTQYQALDLTQYDRQESYYQWESSRRSMSPTLQLMTPESIEAQSLSCHVTVCHGHLPRQWISPGMTLSVKHNLPFSLAVRNLKQPSPFIPEAVLADDVFSCLQALSFLQEPFFDRESFTAILQRFNRVESTHYRDQIAAITAFDVEPMHQVHRGCFYQGLKFIVTIDESAFKSLGAVFHFGSVLDHFLHDSLPMNQRRRLQLHTTCSDQVLVWQDPLI